MSSCPLGWLKNTNKLQWISQVRCCRRIRCGVLSCEGGGGGRDGGCEGVHKGVGEGV